MHRGAISLLPTKHMRFVSTWLLAALITVFGNQISRAVLQINTTSLPFATDGSFYSQTFQASGGNPPYTWSIPNYSAALPAYLSLSTSGVLSGTPDVASGAYYFDVIVTDALLNTAEEDGIRINIAPYPLVITNVSLPGGFQNTSYSVQLGASGGLTPYSWALAQGSANLPAGLTLGSSGLITGTPLFNQTNSFMVQLTDNQSTVLKKVFSIAVAPPLPFRVIYTFTNGADGSTPMGGLTLSGNTLYGATYTGGSLGDGTIFKVNTDGSGFMVLHSFSTNTYNLGANPLGSLLIYSNKLFGTTASGGTAGGYGTLFSLNTDGTGFTNLYNFTYTNRASYISQSYYAGLTIVSNALYGTTTAAGGSYGWGNIFRINTDGTGFTNLHSFNGSDGAYPDSTMVLYSNVLYGTTQSGGFNSSYYGGTAYYINADGTGFGMEVVLATPNPTTGVSFEGAAPNGLTVVGGSIFMTTAQGGSAGVGTVCEQYGDPLHNFAFVTNNGAWPNPGLAASGNTLYGTCLQAGLFGEGTIFSVNTDGTGFTTWHNFTNSEGILPNYGVIQSGGVLYGTTSSGGTNGIGTVYAFSLPSTLTPPNMAPLPAQQRGRFQFSVNGVAGQIFTVQVATNLNSANWIPLATTNPVSGSFTFSDPNATNKMSFYRVVVSH